MRTAIPFMLVTLVGGFFGGLYYSKRCAAPSPEGASAPDAHAGHSHDSEEKPMPGYSFKPNRFNYGKVIEGESRSTKLVIERPKGTALKLGRIFSPCPCIAVSVEKKEFKKQEDAVVKVDIHSLSLIGKPSFPVYVQVVEPVKTILRADVDIEVNRVAAKIKLMPDGFHLGSVSGEKNTSILFYNLTKRPMELKNLKSSIKGVKLAVVGGTRVPAGKVHSISLTVPKDMKRGPLRGVVTVETNLAEHAVVSIPVDGTVLKK